MPPSFARKKSTGSSSIDTNDVMPPDAVGGGGVGGPGDPATGAPPSSDGKKKSSRMKRLVNFSRRKVNGSQPAKAKPKKAKPAYHPDESLGCDGMFSFIEESVQIEVKEEKDLMREQRRMQPFRTFRPAPLHEVAARLQADVEVRDRSDGSTVHPRCFVGSEAVDYLVDNELAPSRPQAVEVGKQLMESLELFDHATGEHDFKDAPLFYRFRAELEFSTEGSLPESSHDRLGSVCDKSARSACSGGSAHTPIIKMDKYGFLLEDERCAADDNGAASADRLARLNLSQARRWENILGKVPSSAKPLDRPSPNGATYATTQSKVKYYARRGMPDGTRRKAWTVLTGVDLIINENPGMYEALVEKASEEYRKQHDLNSAADLSDTCMDSYTGSKGGDVSHGRNVLDVIERDIRRTFPKHYLFQSAKDGEEKEENETQPLASASSLNPPGDYILDHDDHSDQEDEDCSQVESDLGHDTIVDAATSTGQHPRGVVAAKKQLFNQSMELLTQSMALETEGLENTDSIGIAPIDGSDLLPPNKGIEDSEGSDASEHSLDIFGEDDDNFALDPPLAGGQPGLDSSSAARPLVSWMSTDVLGMGRGQDSLRRVLRAYSMYDNEVGYCQGMNFISAMFLTFLTEEEAFWLLVVVMNEEPYKLRELFGEDMAGTHEVLYIAEKLLGQFLPKLARHMEAESVHASMFVTQWLLTVYTSTFPFELVARVWDSFLVEGWKVVYRVMLGLLDYASKDVMELMFEDILDYFKHLPSRVDGQTIMVRSLKIPLKRKHIQKHVNEWRRHASGEGEGSSSKSSGSSRRHALRRRTTDDDLSQSNSTMSQSNSTIRTLASGDMSFSKLAKDVLKRKSSRDGSSAGAKGAKTVNPNDSLGCDGMFSFIEESVQVEVAEERERTQAQAREQPSRTFRPAPLHEVAGRLEADVEV